MSSSYMLKLKYNINIFELRTFWSHDFAEEMDAGFRFCLDLGLLKFGGAVIWENFEHNNEKFHQEVDAQYILLDWLDFSLQASMVDDGLDTTEDLMVFGKLSYSKGIELPVVGKTIPYGGIDSLHRNEDRISLVGLNFAPIPNSFIKAEYRTNTEADLNDVLEFQVGYVF